MKNPFRFSILPFFTMGAGGIGLCLRLWLFSAIDEKGLLPASHPAELLLYILTAVVLGAVFLASRETTPSPFPRGFRQIAEIVGNLVCCICLLVYGLTENGVLLSMIFCVVGSILMLLAALFAFKKKALPYGLAAALTVVLMVITVTRCRAWGAIPQLQYYFFPLLASIFLILSAYYRTVLAAKLGKRKHLAFFSQGALFFCCLSLNSDPFFSLGMGCWAATQLFACYHTKKEP